jgi:SOS-response transcriptional repressor LexA
MRYNWATSANVMDISMATPKGLDHRAIARRIEQRMSELKTNAAAVSRRANLGTTAVHDILSGKSRRPSVDVMISVATALDCDLAYLLGQQETPHAATQRGVAPTPVIGIAEAGAFRPMREVSPDTEIDFPHLNAPRSELYPDAKHFALQVWGDSMNAAKPVPIVQGMHVLCVDVIDAELTIESGKIYVVRQTKDAGQTYELTVKRARVFRDRIELVPESTNPRHQTIVVRLNFESESRKEIAAIGWVYGTYTSLEG